MAKHRLFMVIFLFFWANILNCSCSGSGKNASHISGKDLAFRNEVVQYARSFIGTPYRYGGKSPDTGFDCSGYTSFVFKKFGYSLGASSTIQYRESRRISQKKLLPGDLVFFGSKITRRIRHVGIYAGNNKILHAPSTNKTVGYASLSTGWYHDHYLGAGRILPD